MKFKLIKILFGTALVGSIILYFLDLSEWWVIILVILLYIVLMLVLSTNIRFNFFLKAYHKNPEYPGRVVALSFDDGPVPNTLKILDILDKYEAKAVFFCIGRNIEQYPEIFREVINRGHIVGNHSYSHTRKIGFLPAESILKEIADCDAAAQHIGGVKMNFFRPPFGIINPKIHQALNDSGHYVIGWNVRPYDAITRSPEKVMQRITRNLSSGDLILLHDNIPKTALILEQLLVTLEKRNFGIIRPDILFDIHAYS